MSSNEETPQDTLDYRSQVIAGYNWSPSMYIFSSDDTQLLIPSGSTVRVYSAEDGSYVRTLPDNDEDLIKLHGDTNVSIQLHPYCPDKYVLCFTSGRKLVIICLSTGKIVHYEDLFQHITLPAEQLGQGMDFGACILVVSKKKNKRCDLFFGVKSHFKFYQKELNFPFNKKVTAQAKRLFLVSKEKIDKVVLNKNAAVVVSQASRFIAMINCRALYVLALPLNKPAVMHLKLDNEFTCIASHPSEEIVATGDSLGVITLWRNFINNSQPERSTYHWHPQPVASLAFSSKGSKLFSACASGRLISWPLDTPGVHSEVANLGIPIRGIMTDASNKHLITSLVDGTIKIISSSATNNKNDIVHLLENSISQVDIELDLSKSIRDSASKNILIKGFNGSLQFFSLASNSVTHTLDVTGANYHQNFDGGPQVMDIVLNNIAISPDGQWLATNELREETEFLREEKLKFWTKIDSTYEMVNFIDLPHDKPIKDMKFSLDGSVLVTISGDSYFKVWKRTVDEVSRDEVYIQSHCSNRCSSLTPLALAISCDASILAIQYGDEIACWDISQKNDSLLDHLSDINIDWKDQLIAFSFAAGSLMHLFVSMRKNSVACFNFVNCSNDWKVTNSENEHNVSFSLDESHNIFAVYRSNEVITIYNVESSSPIGVISSDITTSIGQVKSIMALNLSSFFDEEHRVTTCENSTAILCTNDRKQLISLLPRQFVVKRKAPPKPADDVDGGFKIVGKTLPFIHALPTELHPQKRKIEIEFDCDKLVEEFFLQDATHLLPPVDLLCKQFLKCLFLEENPSAGDKKSKN